MNEKDKAKTPTETAELETKFALLQQQFDEQKAEFDRVKADNETLLKLNKQLQLAVGVTTRTDDTTPPEQEKEKSPRELQDALVAKITKHKE